MQIINLVGAILFALGVYAQQVHETVLDRIRRISNENLLTVPAEIDGKAITLVLDSGASAVIVDTAVAQQRHFALAETLSVSGAGSAACAVRTFQAPVRIDGFLVGDRKLAAPLDHLARFLGVSIDGIAGGDLFRSYAVQVDIPRRKVEVMSPRRIHRQANDVVLPLDTTHLPCCIIPGTLRFVEHDISARFIIDTGAPAFGVILSRKLARKYARELGTGADPIELPALCSTTRLIALPSATLIINGIEISVRVYASLEEGGAFAGDSFDAVIGGEVLRQLGTVLINAPAQQIIIRNARPSSGRR